MKLEERIEAFSELGEILRKFLSGVETAQSSELKKTIERQHYTNPWFTRDNVEMSLKAIAEVLTYDNLKKWTGNYPSLESQKNKRNVGVVMAGNIPLAGFHDFLSVLISGNRLLAKTSSKDPDLIVSLSDILCSINAQFKSIINFVDGSLKDFDSVIATGSDNTSRYFEYYFSRYPSIIRRNRNSVAILSGDEANDELVLLGTDIFSYFGLGCRNISKLYVPRGYDLKRLAEHWGSFSHVINHNKYANNYDYNKALLLVNREEFTDPGFVIFKESKNLSSPVSVIYFEFCDSFKDAEAGIEKVSGKIQCIVSRNHVSFGSAQYPSLWDYADGIDTLEFLLKKN